LALIIYNVFLALFRLGISLASLWNRKAILWLEGRKKIFERLNSELLTPDSGLIWMHCSSLGEFEQGRPVLEKIRSGYKDIKILLTFFSPSGYEIRKNYPGVDYVFYLPVDSAENAKRFFEIVNPKLVLFVKYEYWYYYLRECNKRNIPLLMISAIFRENQPFFKWYGGLHRKMLRCFTHLFLQDEKSKELSQSLQINNITVSGDTRFDRVFEIAETAEPLLIIEQFCADQKVLVAGSTWPEDESIIKKAVNSNSGLKLIIAPHEIHDEHLSKLKSLFPGSILFSQLTIHPDIAKASVDKPAFAKVSAGKHSPLTSYNCLIIDNIGMLSKLYRHATITYIGGGFNKGIHNILEAAVYGKPVLFGPQYGKFREAVGLIQYGGGINIRNSTELKNCINKLLTDRFFCEETGKKSFEYVRKNKGATEIILNYIHEKRLLTK